MKEGVKCSTRISKKNAKSSVANKKVDIESNVYFFDMEVANLLHVYYGDISLIFYFLH